MNGIEPPTPMSTGSVPSQASANAARAASYTGPGRVEPRRRRRRRRGDRRPARPTARASRRCARSACVRLAAGRRRARAASRSWRGPPGTSVLGRSPTAGASMPIMAMRRLGPQPLDDAAGADQLDAVEQAGLGAEPLLGVVEVGGLAGRPGPAPPRRRRRRAGWRAAGTARSARRAPRRRTCRCARAWSSVATSTTTRTMPRSVVVSAGTPMSQLPESAMTMTSAASSSRCSLEQRRQRCRSRTPPRPR